MALSMINSPEDLVTSHQAICEGFLNQAIEKGKLAIPYIDQAKRLWNILQEIDSIDELMSISSIQSELLTASGFSDKAKNRLSNLELTSAIKRVLQTVIEDNKDDWKTEILYRYLLTRGDSLGGSMRNLTGALASSRFSDAVINELQQRNVIPQIKYSSSNSSKTQSIIWKNRLLVFDRTPKFIGKNIDVILLDTSFVSLDDDEKIIINNENFYLACGEIKGGIDPAGADEHWKTARSALERIRSSFEKLKLQYPQLFFVGAAIERSMAEEIFKQINEKSLNHAANFTVKEQVEELVSWLVAL